ncbi:MAG: hypothetical protein AAB214_19030, partial [Fibrobacterota bacterium]
MTTGAYPPVHLRWIGATRVLTPVALFLGALTVQAGPVLWIWIAFHVVADIGYLTALLRTTRVDKKLV